MVHVDCQKHRPALTRARSGARTPNTIHTMHCALALCPSPPRKVSKMVHLLLSSALRSLQFWQGRQLFDLESDTEAPQFPSSKLSLHLALSKSVILQNLHSNLYFYVYCLSMHLRRAAATPPS
ncbi:hypothetical protein C8F01DRAFT_1369565 [Mycena amicta]|nr:hypothetical protein C8F01DRAFT_1369565 [Mycena amicta]